MAEGTRASDEPPARPAVAALAVATTLAAVAGFVDAVGFNRLFGVFPANQSGNVAFLGMAIGGDGPAAGWRCALSIGGFALGAAAGFAFGHRLRPGRRGPTLIVVELVLLVIVTIVADSVHGGDPAGGSTGVVLVLLGSLAMGIQTEAIRRVAGISIATTYQSGAVARIGEATVGAFGRSGAVSRVPALPILTAVLVTYCAGAALGATAPARWRVPLALPIAMLLVLVLLWSCVPRWFAAIDADTDRR